MARTNVMIFWDYDTQWGADRSRSGTVPQDWGPKEFDGAEMLIELHGRFSVPACFAVVGAAALPGERPYHDPDQVRRLHEAGHEIASHTMRHEWVPALKRAELLTTLCESKHALEQCTGAPVVSFVPPFNEPYAGPGVIKPRELRGNGDPHAHLDVPMLCETLARADYRVCRVSRRRTLARRCAEKLARRSIARPLRATEVAGVRLIDLSAFGFHQRSIDLLRSRAGRPGILAFYGHPHGVCIDGPESYACVENFLGEVNRLREAGLIQVGLPRELLSERSEEYSAPRSSAILESGVDG